MLDDVVTGHVIVTRGWLEPVGAPALGLGEPAYYGRFGFRAAEELGVLAPEPGWGRHSQARWLAGQRTGGTFRYADPFRRL